MRPRRKLSSNRKGTINTHNNAGTTFAPSLKSLPIVLKALVGFVVMQLIILFGVSLLWWDTSPRNASDSELSNNKSGAGSIFNNLRRRSLVHHGDSNSTAAVSVAAPPQIAKPLGDYTSRQHMSLSTRNASDLPILVVGGSDGSGTRAFVDMLGRLGVPMLIDDTGTGDVHAKCMFDGDGWPALVRSVLKTTQKANYSWEDFSLVQRAMLQSTVDRFRNLYGIRGEALRQHGIEDGFPVAEKVLYGFKAPVSMLLLPILRQVYGRIKFLHVLRDGRDVSLSKNKSPVQKFYQVFYPNATKRQKEFESIVGDTIFEEAMAMQLWNDWNLQVLDWESKHSDGETFDYLVLRTEDLMDPTTRLTSLRQLAQFVGSKKTDTEICCLSKQQIKDMGQSGVRQKRNQTHRYHEHREPTFSDKLSWFLNRLWYKIMKFFGMTKHRFGESTSVSNHFPSGFAHLKRRGGRLFGNGDESHLSDVAGVQQEAHIFDKRLRERRPELFRKLQLRRKRIQEQKYLNAQTHDEYDDEKHSPDERRLDEQERNSHGDAVRVPWRNETKRPRAVVNHVEYDTMLERVKEAETKAKSRYQQYLTARFVELKTEQHVDEPESQQEVMKRYGKWMKAVEGRPELNRVLHEQGAMGLRIFGYEPRARYSDFPEAGVCETPANCKRILVQP